jgi:hypothetical protein
MAKSFSSESNEALAIRAAIQREKDAERRKNKKRTQKQKHKRSIQRKSKRNNRKK